MSVEGEAPRRWQWPDTDLDAPTKPTLAAPGQSGNRGRIKILHVITKFVDGAGGNTLVSTMGLDQALWEPWIASAPGGPLWDRAQSQGITMVRLRHMRSSISPIEDVRAVFELMRLMRKHRFAVVHTHSSKAGVVGRLAARLARVPVVVHTIHGFSWHDFMSRGRRSFYIALERLARPLTDALVAVSPAVAAEAVRVRVARAEQLSVIPSAIELDDIPTSTTSSMRQELGVPAGVPLVGTMGRFDLQKAPLDFIRMAARVASTHPHTRFVMIGEGELLDAARDEARRLGVEVTFAGHRQDAATVASCFDVYVVTSLYEGVGRALCEALASGRPVIATAVNGVVDVIEPGVTGLLVPPRDVQGMARGVSWMLDHPEEARRFGEVGRARVRTIFRPELMCRLLEAEYLRLLRGNGKS